MVTYETVISNDEIRTYILQADDTMQMIGYTEHGLAHATRTAVAARDVLIRLNYSERAGELASIAGYMHDIGNVVNRVDHAQSGAVMAFCILDKMGMPPTELARVVSAIGNHDEHTAFPVNELAAALILADKSDVRRTRVRDFSTLQLDIHDRVNYAVERATLAVEPEDGIIRLTVDIDTTTCPVSDYFEIFLDRMLLCRRAAQFFNLQFALEINGSRLM